MKTLAAVLCLLATPAFSQAACGPRGLVVAKLIEEHQEAVVGRGASGGMYVFEVWRNPETGAWTITQTDVRGRTCVMTAGQSWEIVAPVEGEAS